MKIILNDLITLCRIIITKSQRVGLEEIEAQSDKYWNIPSGESYNFNLKEAPVEIRSLQSDVEDLRKLLNGERTADSSDFERLGNIIMFLGTEIQKSQLFYGSPDCEYEEPKP